MALELFPATAANADISLKTSFTCTFTGPQAKANYHLFFIAFLSSIFGWSWPTVGSSLHICEALHLNREHVIFWVNWVFGIIVIRSTILVLFNLILKSISYSYIWKYMYDHLWIRT